MANNPKVNIGGPNGYKMEIKGFNTVLQNLRLTKDQSVRLQKFLKEEAFKIVKTAKQIVPVKTGRLKDSHRVITYGTTGKRGYVRVDVVAGGISVRGKFVNYAAAVHEGTPKKGGRPWLRTAARMHLYDARFMHRLKAAIKIGGRR